MKKTILLLTLLTLISTALSADTKTNSNLTEKKNENIEVKKEKTANTKSWAITKDEQLENMMSRYQGE